jgi:beta-1,4-mannosyl-glycoprotein beta-1,4-N-acetylglucosaminyltransferase
MIIDCFPFFNELDLLEVRLHELAPFVDRFVLAECTQTHSGNEKPLFFENNKERFKEFNITHIIIPRKEGNSWDREIFGREYLIDNAGADPEDLILLSDVDEIPDLRGYTGEEGVFKQELCYFFFNGFHKRSWMGTFATKKKNIDTFCFDPALRMLHKKRAKVVGGGWHFSSLGSLGDVRYKIESCAHQELNTEAYKRKMDRLRDDTKIITDKGTCPPWLSENKERYPHLFRK